MDLETLQKANDLATQIERLETEKTGWKHAERFSYSTISLKTCKDIEVGLNVRHIDLDVLRSITIANIDKELKPLKEELAKL